MSALPFPPWWSFDLLEVLRQGVADHHDAASGMRAREGSSRHAAELCRSRLSGAVLVVGDCAAVLIVLSGGGVSVRPVPTGQTCDVRIVGSGPLIRTLLAGRGSGIRAYLEGHLAITGDFGLALRFDALLGDHGDVMKLATGVVEVPFANRHSVRTAYFEMGDRARAPVILLHGLGATGASLLPTAAALAAEHRVIVPDVVGFGDSDKPYGRYDAAFFAAWLRRFMDTVGVPRAALVGNSLGGRIAIELAVTTPGYVSQVALLTPSLAWRRRRQLVPVLRLLRQELGVALPLSSRPAVRWALTNMLADVTSVPSTWREASVDEFLRSVRSPRARVALLASARQIYLEAPSGFWERLGTISAPSLFVFGQEDRLVPAAFARHVRRALPAASVVILPNCGHVPQLECPSAVHELLKNFLRGDVSTVDVLHEAGEGRHSS